MKKPKYVEKHGILSERVSGEFRLWTDDGVTYRLTLNAGDQERAKGMLGDTVIVMGDLYPGYLIRVSSIHL